VRPLQRGELRSRIAARTREDFRSGRTVCVEGWILARTEALIYAVLVVA
jgi:acyl CoA:acetate/3-ketoacid CoA transferase alpha subunit